LRLIGEPAWRLARIAEKPDLTPAFERVKDPGFCRGQVVLGH
jgi:hypothetical protein